jgi:hypothetical protein
VNIEREAISKKLRFEIFKRDCFKCQYCSRGAPDVLLEVDHIKPVCEGGETHILNLITSCFDCNRGKSGILLSDSSMLEKQRKQLELLEERRQQIELMMEWHNSQQDIDALKLDKIVAFLNEKIKPFKLNENGIKSLNKIIKKYDLLEILEAIDSTFDYYVSRGLKDFEKDKSNFNMRKNAHDNGRFLSESEKMVFQKQKDFFENPHSYLYTTYKLIESKLPGILRNRRKEKEDPDFKFIERVYRYNKYQIEDYGDYGFAFKSIEMLYKKLRFHGIEPDKSASIMCYKKWDNFNEMLNFIEENLKLFPLDFSNSLC